MKKKSVLRGRFFYAIMVSRIDLGWKAQIEGADNLPWDVSFLTIKGGTHAASAPQVYREGMRILFGWENTAKANI